MLWPFCSFFIYSQLYRYITFEISRSKFIRSQDKPMQGTLCSHMLTFGVFWHEDFKLYLKTYCQTNSFISSLVGIRNSPGPLVMGLMYKTASCLDDACQIHQHRTGIHAISPSDCSLAVYTKIMN